MLIYSHFSNPLKRKMSNFSFWTAKNASIFYASIVYSRALPRYTPDSYQYFHHISFPSIFPSYLHSFDLFSFLFLPLHCSPLSSSFLFLPSILHFPFLVLSQHSPLFTIFQKFLFFIFPPVFISWLCVFLFLFGPHPFFYLLPPRAKMILQL